MILHWERWQRWGNWYTKSAGGNDEGGGSNGRAVDPGTLDYWQGGNMPPFGANSINAAMNFWQAGNMPPVVTVE